MGGGRLCISVGLIQAMFERCISRCKCMYGREHVIENVLTIVDLLC